MGERGGEEKGGDNGIVKRMHSAISTSEMTIGLDGKQLSIITYR